MFSKIKILPDNSANIFGIVTINNALKDLFYLR